jgi:hypothetical protein
LDELAAFFGRHKRLKRIVLCLERLEHDEEDNDRQEEDGQQDGERNDQLVKKIQAIFGGIHHDIRVVDSMNYKWIES